MEPAQTERGRGTLYKTYVKQQTVIRDWKKRDIQVEGYYVTYLSRTELLSALVPERWFLLSLPATRQPLSVPRYEVPPVLQVPREGQELCGYLREVGGVRVTVSSQLSQSS